MTQEFDIGLDVSTSIIGICIVDRKTGALVYLASIKLNKARLVDIWDKALEFRKEFQNILIALSATHPGHVFKRIYVEDIAKKFSPGFSSAGTIVILAKMNAIVCMSVYDALGIKPTFVNVRSARATLGVKINTADKTKSTKEKVFEIVQRLNPSFPWTTHVAKTGKKKGQTVFDTECQDMADSWVVARGGQSICP